MRKFKSRQTGRVISYLGMENGSHFFFWDDDKTETICQWLVEMEDGFENFEEYFIEI